MSTARTGRAAAHARLATLAGADRPARQPPAADDELVFIVVHQVQELWFDSMLPEFWPGLSGLSSAA
jgi:tryptophan 2,3-dioxygenase